MEFLVVACSHVLSMPLERMQAAITEGSLIEEALIGKCGRCSADLLLRLSHTPKNPDRWFAKCSGSCEGFQGWISDLKRTASEAHDLGDQPSAKVAKKRHDAPVTVLDDGESFRLIMPPRIPYFFSYHFFALFGILPFKLHLTSCPYF